MTADDVLDVLDRWSDTGAEMPRGQRLARLRGGLLGDDGRTTMAIASRNLRVTALLLGIAIFNQQ